MGPFRALLCTGMILSLFLSFPGTGLSSDEERHEAEAVTSEAANRENPVPSTETSVAAGKTKYTTFCVGCHGTSAKGDGPKARMLPHPPADLTRAVRSDSEGELFGIIENGYGSMPAWKSVLSEEDIWNILNYVKTLPE